MESCQPIKRLRDKKKKIIIIIVVVVVSWPRKAVPLQELWGYQSGDQGTSLLAYTMYTGTDVPTFRGDCCIYSQVSLRKWT